MVVLSEERPAYSIELAPLDITLNENFEPILLHDMSLIENWYEKYLILPKAEKALIYFDGNDLEAYPKNEPKLSQNPPQYDRKKGVLYVPYTDELIAKNYFEYAEGALVGVDKDRQIVEFWFKNVPKINI